MARSRYNSSTASSTVLASNNATINLILKVWTGKGSVLHPVVETRKHTKAVTSLVISPEKEIIYSGSLDRTIRVRQPFFISFSSKHC